MIFFAQVFSQANPLGAMAMEVLVLQIIKKLYNKLKIIRNHGQKSKNDHHILGLNARMDELQACILNSKIKLFKNEIILRNQVALAYDKLLCNKRYYFSS